MKSLRPLAVAHDRAARRTARRRGLTLIEIVLAMGLLAMGLTAVIGVFSAASELGVSARRRAEAASALEYVTGQVTERLFPIDAEGLVGEPAIVEDEPVPGYEGLTYSVVPVLSTVTPPPGMPPVYRVDVTVRWSEQGRSKALHHRMLLPAAVSMGDRLRRQVFGFAPIESTAPPEDDPDADDGAEGAGSQSERATRDTTPRDDR
ncbi:MAG: prepilin-type N-terminal cleavage/methylation domain-containing protein [Planctomycetota bacterium]